jgi:hypothetical protein
MPALPGNKSGWQDSNLRELAPKASGRPLPHILKNGADGNRTRNYWFARPAPCHLATTPNRSGGDRTHDLRFVRPMLLPLSYAPKKFDWETWIRTTIGGFRVRSPAN